MSNGVMKSEFDHPYLIKVAVPNDKVGIIIGKGGMTVRNLQEKCKVLPVLNCKKKKNIFVNLGVSVYPACT